MSLALSTVGVDHEPRGGRDAASTTTPLSVPRVQTATASPVSPTATCGEPPLALSTVGVDHGPPAGRDAASTACPLP